MKSDFFREFMVRSKLKIIFRMKVNFPRSSRTTITGLSSLKIILHHTCAPSDRPDMSLPAPLDRLKNMLHHISVGLWRYADTVGTKLRLSCKLKLALPSRPSQVTAGRQPIDRAMDRFWIVRTYALFNSIISSNVQYSRA
jgi:hypothetical protein